MNVGTLRKLLETYSDDEPIVFQFIVAEHTSFSKDEFREIANYLEDSDQFGEDTAEVMTAWIAEADDVLASVEEQEN